MVLLKFIDFSGGLRVVSIEKGMTIRSSQRSGFYKIKRNTHGTVADFRCGQYGLVAKEVAEAMNCFSQIDFLDDHSEVAIGELNDIENTEYDATFVAIGNPAVRSQYLDRIEKAAHSFIQELL